MTDFNKWIGTGYLATEPKMYETQAGKPYARARVAVQRGWGENKDSMFVTCQFWGSAANFLMQYGAVGRRVMMEAELSVFDKKDSQGNYSSSVFINVYKFQFIDSMNKQNNNSDYSEEDSNPLEEAYGGDLRSRSVSADEDNEEIPF